MQHLILKLFSNLSGAISKEKLKWYAHFVWATACPQKLPQPGTQQLPVLQSGATAVGQHTCSPELTEALQMRDKQYFIFHPDVDYEPGKRKLKRWTASFGISWNLCIVSKESQQRGQATVWEFYSQ